MRFPLRHWIVDKIDNKNNIIPKRTKQSRTHLLSLNKKYRFAFDFNSSAKKKKTHKIKKIKYKK